jgi:hypothetical protein
VGFGFFAVVPREHADVLVGGAHQAVDGDRVRHPPSLFLLQLVEFPAQQLRGLFAREAVGWGGALAVRDRRQGEVRLVRRLQQVLCGLVGGGEAEVLVGDGERLAFRASSHDGRVDMSAILAQPDGGFFVGAAEVQHADVGEREEAAVVFEVDEIREVSDGRVRSELDVRLHLGQALRRGVRTERERNDVGVGGVVHPVRLDQHGGILCGGVHVEDVRYGDHGGFVQPRGHEEAGVAQKHPRKLRDLRACNGEIDIVKRSHCTSPGSSTPGSYSNVTRSNAVGCDLRKIFLM